MTTESRRSVGVVTTDHIAAGVVAGRELLSPLRVFPEDPARRDELLSMPAENIAKRIFDEILALNALPPIDAIGLAFPGISRNGMIEESPNLPQLKGAAIVDTIVPLLRFAEIHAPVSLYNDADVMAAGLAATRDELHRRVRVWTLGNGVGFGVYPHGPGIWEGGHMTVTLDPNENYCGCGGKGHLEGIMGHRAMRRRFLDMEPEEIFQHAAEGDERCAEFVKLWHHGLAAATANSIHIAGPGKFLICGFNASHINVDLLHEYVQEMVKMSPLQDYAFEVVAGGDDIAVIGAAVNALQATFADTIAE